MNNKGYYEFYKECLQNNFLDFSDNYQRQKIQLLAQKYGLVFDSSTFTIQMFEESRNKYNEFLNEQKNEKQKAFEKEHNELVKKIKEEDNAVISYVDKYSELVGRKKVIAVCTDIINENQKIVDKIDRQKKKEYKENKEKIIPSALVGGTIEGLTGSSLAGLYNAVNNEELNEAKKVHNALLSDSIDKKYSEERAEANVAVRSAKKVLQDIQTAYIDTDILLGKNIVVNDLEMIVTEAGSLRIKGNISTSKIKNLPNNIKAYIDGTLKALIYNRETDAVEEEMLITLDYDGLSGTYNKIEGVKQDTKLTKDNIDQYGCVFVDYNLFAVECSRTDFYVLEKPSYSSVFNEYYISVAKDSLSKGGIDNLLKAKKYANYVRYCDEAEELENEATNAISNYYYNQGMIALDSNDTDAIKEAIRNTDNILESNEKKDLYDKLKNHLVSVENEASIKKEQNEKRELERIEIKKKNKKRNVIALGAISFAVVLLAIVYFLVLAPMDKYKKAIAYMEKNDYVNAYVLFEQLGDYKDSKERVEKCYSNLSGNEKAVLPLIGKTTGDTVTFGSYEQDNDSSNGKEKIEWYVIKQDGNKLLLLSKCIILEEDAEWWHDAGYYWEKCSLRKKLNEDFYDTAFSSYEKNCIQLSDISPDANPKYDVPQGNATKDKVFVLSINEANELLSSSQLKASPTQYAVSEGCEKERNSGLGNWWLRTTGAEKNFCTYVNQGKIIERGHDASEYTVAYGGFTGVRPSIWVVVNP